MQRRETYLLKHFFPKVINPILKRNKQPHLRSLPKEWPVINEKLKDAGLLARSRNELLRQYKFGFQFQNPIHSSSQSNSIASKEQDNDVTMLESYVARSTPAPKPSLRYVFPQAST